jgi:hypothetical protein
MAVGVRGREADGVAGQEHDRGHRGHQDRDDDEADEQFGERKARTPSRTRSRLEAGVVAAEDRGEAGARGAGAASSAAVTRPELLERRHG